jgi:uncharacterized protein
MKIKLNEIPEDGREYHLNRKTGEINTELQDLIADHPYELKFTIRPLNSKDYELKGSIETHTKELCSLCGETFKFKVNTKIHEILIESAGEDKELEKQSRSNHFSELNQSGPSVLEYKDATFDVGPFTHEVIGLSVPFNPKPELEADGSCKVCLQANMNQSFRYDEDMSTFEKAKEQENPFSILKGLKIN